MKENFWKKLVQIYLQASTEDAINDLKKLREDVENSDIKEEDRKRMLSIIDEVLNSNNVMATLKSYTETEITKFIGGDLCY